MLALPLSEFIEGEYASGYDVGVYVVWSDVPLYVGKSSGNIWNRWFTNQGKHLWLNRDGTVAPAETKLGYIIHDKWPASADWLIEIWNTDDCRELFAGEIDRLGWVTDRVDLTAFEQMMIHRLNPQLNVLT